MITPEVLKVVDHVYDGFHIPSRPQSLATVEYLLQKGQPDLNQLAEHIIEDVGLSSMVLKMINSPGFGNPGKMGDIKQAVHELGSEIVGLLMIGVSLQRAYDQEPCISFERFWDNNMDVAHAMLIIAKHARLSLPASSLYTLGLFHNCGIPAFALKYPDYKETLIAMDSRDDLPGVIIEDEKYGTNHAVLGYFIAKSWEVPDDICYVILNHHELKFLETEKDMNSRWLYSVLKLAENMVNQVRRFNDTPDWPFVSEDVLTCLHFDEDALIDLEEHLADSFNL